LLSFNDSDQDAKGQKGWVGWGNHTIVYGKNPEEMQTLVLGTPITAVNARGKLTTTWETLKQWLHPQDFRTDDTV